MFKQRHAAKNKTAASSDLQRRFNQYVAEMVSLDGLPFSVTRGLGFKRVVEFLRPEINMPSPRTVARQLEHLAANEALPALQDELLGVPEGGLHFVIDIWTSRLRQAILGIRVHFIKDWNLRHYMLSFKHMRGKHTGENIRETFLAELESRGVSEALVGAVVCDNASNMTKAFNMSENFDDDWKERVADPEDCEEHEATDMEVDDKQEDTGQIPSFKRVRCAAHTLQLAVNSALRGDEAAQRLLTSVNAAVNVFRRSCFWSEQLRDQCGKDLVPASGTRWNSLVAALKRLTEPAVFAAVVSLINQYNNEHPKKPVSVSAGEFTIARLQALLKLLRPLADATDRLQGDGVTSGELHLTISGCYAQVGSYSGGE